MVANLLGRNSSLFEADFATADKEIKYIARNSSFMVVGGAGTIGAAVIKILIRVQAKKIFIVDISENNLVELMRDIRSSETIIMSEIQTFAIDCASEEFIKLFNAVDSIDYLLNFSALKHVRSEENPYTLKRLVDVNILNAMALLDLAEKKKCRKYFCVSTDKATNPINMMGASKQIMERLVFSCNSIVNVTTARFANVIFSDGSLFYGFENRIKKNQPLAVPKNIRRFFITSEEAAQLCVIATLIGNNKEILFPKTNSNFKDMSLVDLARNYLQNKGYKVKEFDNEFSAKQSFDKLIKNGKYPCIYSNSDTTGEKGFEEFYSNSEKIDMQKFQTIGVVNFRKIENFKQKFLEGYQKLKNNKEWKKKDFVSFFDMFLENFTHDEKFKNLNQKM